MKLKFKIVYKFDDMDKKIENFYLCRLECKRREELSSSKAFDWYRVTLYSRLVNPAEVARRHRQWDNECLVALKHCKQPH